MHFCSHIVEGIRNKWPAYSYNGGKIHVHDKHCANLFYVIVSACVLQIRLLESIQLVAAKIPIPENETGPVILLQTLFAVSVQEVNPQNFESQVLSVSLGDSPFSKTQDVLREDNLNFFKVNNSTASITLPKNLFDSFPASNFSRITQLVFLNDALYLRRNETSLEVGSIIIAASVAEGIIEHLEPPISLTFLKNPVSHDGHSCKNTYIINCISF